MLYEQRLIKVKVTTCTIVDLTFGTIGNLRQVNYPESLLQGKLGKDWHPFEISMKMKYIVDKYVEVINVIIEFLLPWQ